MSGFNWNVGDEAVALDDVVDVKKGGIYKVSMVLPPLPFGDGRCGLRFEGVSTKYGPNQGYSAHCFRPVHRTKTDLSIEAFSTIKPGYEEPKRERVKKGVGV